MATLTEKTLVVGQPFQLVNVKYRDGGVGELISTGNDYTGLKPFQLGQLEGDREVSAVLDVRCCEATEDFTLKVNDDFDGLQSAPSKAMTLEPVVGFVGSTPVPPFIVR